MAMAKEKGLATLASTVCATGGGAYKFEADIKREVNLRLNKFDELDSLIRGTFKLKLDFIFLLDGNSFYMSPSQTSLKIFKHYKLKPSFSKIKDNKAKDRPPSFDRSINPI